MDNKQQNNNIINDLLNNTSIVNVISNYINLIKKGQNYFGLCPFHGDRNPSLCVNENKKIFKCFVCNESGNSINFIQKYKKINFYQALKEIIELTNYKSDSIAKFLETKVDSNSIKMFEMNNQACFIYHRTLFNPSNKDKLNYLLKRNLNTQLIEEYKIGYAPEKDNRKYLFSIMTNEDQLMGDMRDKSLIWNPIQLVNNGLANCDENNNYTDFFWNRIIIPIFDEHDNIVGFSGRTLNKDEKIKYINTKTTEIFKKENVLFNFNNFNKTEYEELYVVEGYMDVFAFRRMQIDNVVASMGTSFTENHINLIKKYKNLSSVIICFDNDQAGFNATIDLAKKLFKANLKVFVVAPYEIKYKDIDELLNDVGKQKTLEAIKNQITFVNYLAIKFLNDPLLSQKEKVTLSKKILDIILDYAYDELSIDNDLAIIAQYSNISLNSLKNYIQQARKPKINYYNKKNKEFSSILKIPEIEEIYLPKISNNNYSIDQVVNRAMANSKNETELFKLICINNDVAKLFNKYINRCTFQPDNATRNMYQAILYFIKLLLDSNQEVNSTTLLNLALLKKDELKIDDVKLSEFILGAKKYYDNFNTTEYDIYQQGISLIIDLLIAIKNEVEIQMFKENRIDINEQFIKLQNEHSKKIKELMNLKESI